MLHSSDKHDLTVIIKRVKLSYDSTHLSHISHMIIFQFNSPLHVGITLRSALNGTLSGLLGVTLADESWKSPLIEDKKYN